MPHVHTLHEEQNVLGDVGGVVGDALQIARHRKQRQSFLNIVRVLLHVTHQLVIARRAKTAASEILN